MSHQKRTISGDMDDDRASSEEDTNGPYRTKGRINSMGIVTPSTKEGCEQHCGALQVVNPQRDLKFPLKLFEMLEQIHRDDDNGSTTDVVSWSADGKSFRVHNPKRFQEHILPRYFMQTRYRSFQRQLNHYGFDRIVKGPLEGGYRHPNFVRDDRTRCYSMRRIKRGPLPAMVSPSSSSSKINKGVPFNKTSTLVETMDASDGLSVEEDENMNRNANRPTKVAAPVSPEPSFASVESASAYYTPVPPCDASLHCLQARSDHFDRPLSPLHQPRIRLMGSRSTPWTIAPPAELPVYSNQNPSPPPPPVAASPEGGLVVRHQVYHAASPPTAEYSPHLYHHPPPPAYYQHYSTPLVVSPHHQSSYRSCYAVKPTMVSMLSPVTLPPVANHSAPWVDTIHPSPVGQPLRGMVPYDDDDYTLHYSENDSNHDNHRALGSPVSQPQVVAPLGGTGLDPLLENTSKNDKISHTSNQSLGDLFMELLSDSEDDELSTDDMLTAAAPPVDDLTATPPPPPRFSPPGHNPYPFLPHTVPSPHRRHPHPLDFEGTRIVAI